MVGGRLGGWLGRITYSQPFANTILPLYNTTDYHQRSKSYIYIYKLMNIYSLIRVNIVSISLYNDKHIAINE